MPGHLVDNFLLPVFYSSSPPPELAPIKTIVDLIEFNAKNNSDSLFCLQAEKALNGSRSPPFLRITYKMLRDMILGCQQLLLSDLKGEIREPYRDQSGSAMRSRPVAVLVDSDVGLLLHLFGLMGLGVPVCSFHSMS